MYPVTAVQSGGRQAGLSKAAHGSGIEQDTNKRPRLSIDADNVGNTQQVGTFANGELSFKRKQRKARADKGKKRGPNKRTSSKYDGAASPNELVDSKHGAKESARATQRGTEISPGATVAPMQMVQGPYQLEDRSMSLAGEQSTHAVINPSVLESRPPSYKYTFKVNLF